ncbi:hypothetical protein ABZT17_34670 [Streptomyces sp. NPDC005648]|uniref:hypothetical protein n=1 Tax=Streptomyces sp. NPDC005648 TaxID=3157044 RepID=UPI0033B0C7B6
MRGGGRDALRGYAVLIDGAQAGSIRRGQTLRFDVPAGTHQLQLKIDWCTSRALSTLVEEGGTVRFICAPGGDASEGLAAVGDGGGSYITLRQARTSESTVMARTPMGRRARLLVGAAIGFLAGGVTLFGALIWHWTGLAPKADTAVAGVGLALTLVSMIVFRLGRRTLK